MRTLSALTLTLSLTGHVVSAAGGEPTSRQIIKKFQTVVNADATIRYKPVVAQFSGDIYLYSAGKGRVKADKIFFKTKTFISGKQRRREWVMKIGIVPFKLLEIVDGEKGWSRINDGDIEPIDKSGAMAIWNRDSLTYIAFGLETFESPEWSITSPISTEVIGQPAWMIVGTKKGMPPFTMYFDKKSGLLLRLRTEAKDTSPLPGSGGKLDTFIRDVYVLDWQDFSGHMIPKTIQAFKDGVLSVHFRYNKISLPDRIDPELFAQPRVEKSK